MIDTTYAIICDLDINLVKYTAGDPDTRRFRITLKYNISGKYKVKSQALQNSGNEQELNRLGI